MEPEGQVRLSVGFGGSEVRPDCLRVHSGLGGGQL